MRGPWKALRTISDLETAVSVLADFFFFFGYDRIKFLGSRNNFLKTWLFKEFNLLVEKRETA